MQLPSPFYQQNCISDFSSGVATKILSPFAGGLSLEKSLQTLLKKSGSACMQAKNKGKLCSFLLKESTVHAGKNPAGTELTAPESA